MGQIRRAIIYFHELVRQRLPAGLVRAASWSVFDQAIVSGTNFVVMVMAARVLGPAQFGIFAILITVLTFMEATQRSLITTPHNVLGANKADDDYRTYTSTAGITQVGLAAIFGVASAVAGLVFLQIDQTTGLMILATAFAAIAWQCQEFTRRVLYTETRVPAAVAGDITTYAGRILMVGSLVFGGLLTGPLLMLVYGLSWFSGAMVGVWNIRNSLKPVFDRSCLTDNWQFGKWLFASSSFAHIPTYAVAALLSSVLSVSAFGAYRAFEQLANGTNVPLSAMSNVLRPRMARQARQGSRSVWKVLMRPIMLSGGAALLLFAGAYIVFREGLVGTIYGSEYLVYTSAVVLVAIRPFLTLQKSILTKALQAFRNTRSVFIGTAAGTTVGTISGGALILLFGLPAAGSIVILSSVVTILWFAAVWHGELTNEAGWRDNLKQDPASMKLD